MFKYHSTASLLVNITIEYMAQFNLNYFKYGQDILCGHYCYNSHTYCDKSKL